MLLYAEHGLITARVLQQELVHAFAAFGSITSVLCGECWSEPCELRTSLNLWNSLTQVGTCHSLNTMKEESVLIPPPLQIAGPVALVFVHSQQKCPLPKMPVELIAHAATLTGPEQLGCTTCSAPVRHLAACNEATACCYHLNMNKLVEVCVALQVVWNVFLSTLSHAPEIDIEGVSNAVSETQRIALEAVPPALRYQFTPVDIPPIERLWPEGVSFPRLPSNLLLPPFERLLPEGTTLPDLQLRWELPKKITLAPTRAIHPMWMSWLPWMGDK